MLLNTSHTHAGVALPDYMPDTPEQMTLKERYRRCLVRGARRGRDRGGRRLQPARIGCGWGESTIGVYRREARDGRDVLGEVPGHPIDPCVGVIRVDDLDGNPIATVFRYSCHPVTMGPRSLVASSDFPGAARDVVEKSLGGLALFLQGCGGNINPRAGMGSRSTAATRRTASAWSWAAKSSRSPPASAPTGVPGERRPLGNVPNILFTPWEPVDGDTCTHLAAAESTIALDYVDLPPPAEPRRFSRLAAHARASDVHADALEWEVRVAEKQEDWAGLLVEAAEREHPTCDLFIQAIRVNDIVIAG